MDDLETSLVLLQVVPVTYLVAGALIVPAVLYVIARWRAQREAVADPQLGIKVALSCFAVTAFQLVLAGVTLVIYGVLSGAPSDTRGTFYRSGLGLVLPAGIVLATHLALLARTNQERFPQVRRLFDGFNLLVTGVLGFAALVLAFESLFKRGSSHELGRLAGAAVLVYGSAWAAVGVRFGRGVLDARADEASPRPLPPLPVLPETPVPIDAPTLPSLGGGAFPPIAAGPGPVPSGPVTRASDK
jgi:hypothetical protein